jgi:hypothetical protein
MQRLGNFGWKSTRNAQGEDMDKNGNENPNSRDVTFLLHQWQQGEAAALEQQYAAGRELLESILKGGLIQDYGIEVTAPLELADDPAGDQLGALLCSIQAAWAWTLRKEGFGPPNPCDATEGWIADPAATK